MTIKRIAFACKWIDRPDQVNGIKPKDECKKYNTGTTTIAWLNRQAKSTAEDKLWDLMKENIESVKQLILKVSEQPESLRMLRISSDLLPAYTEASWRYFWQLPDVKLYAEHEFSKVGDIARSNNVRLSFHPGQFCVMASDSPDIVDRSIEEFEYHADMARYMGYGKTFQDFKINVHIAGRLGPQGIREAYTRLSPEAKNCLTIENEEMKHGLSDCLELSDIIPIVLDIHHNWIREGEYIQPDDIRVKRVIDSWRGVRPTCHFSCSREDILLGHDPDILPDMATLLASGYNKSKLRAHSDFYWNNAVNQWAITFADNFDLMCESKGKNLASFALYENFKQTFI